MVRSELFASWLSESKSIQLNRRRFKQKNRERILILSFKGGPDRLVNDGPSSSLETPSPRLPRAQWSRIAPGVRGPFFWLTLSPSLKNKSASVLLKHATSFPALMILYATIGLLWRPTDASVFRGRVPIVDGKCNVTAHANTTKLLEDGESLSMGKPQCAKIQCNLKLEELVGEVCWAISCDDECRPIAKDPQGVFPDCCLSECDCRDPDLVIDPVSS
ncbi:hypothetical protein BIW11_11841 [Tropilaelaps mercedesae]|uniref:Single domain-containing protein n=1 Tax=Tropilaelaps mercedesae TaxID=418985 RepID=A0A1V9X9S9_9ACAR|nr:hypothetical protein BIW11_11841 [Tropilaelaps mercedesae]